MVQKASIKSNLDKLVFKRLKYVSRIIHLFLVLLSIILPQIPFQILEYLHFTRERVVLACLKIYQKLKLEPSNFYKNEK